MYLSNIYSHNQSLPLCGKWSPPMCREWHDIQNVSDTTSAKIQHLSQQSKYFWHYVQEWHNINKKQTALYNNCPLQSWYRSPWRFILGSLSHLPTTSHSLYHTASLSHSSFHHSPSFGMRHFTWRRCCVVLTLMTTPTCCLLLSYRTLTHSPCL